MPEQVRSIPLVKIARNPDQPRETFPEEHIKRLADSIAKRGLIQPITVRPNGKRFMIVAGECRFRAHQLLKRTVISAIVVKIDAQEMQLRAIVENLQRRDMNPIEEGRAFKTLCDNGYGLQRIVDELGLTGTALVQNRLDLLDLDPDVQKLVANGTLPLSMGWAVRLAPRNQQTRIVRDIAAGKLRTVEQVRHAGIALRDALAQIDAFADKPVSPKDMAAISRLERKIISITAMVCAGFKNGECVAAQRVSPDRVIKMADSLGLIRKHVLQMEHELRCVATQSQITIDFQKSRKKK